MNSQSEIYIKEDADKWFMRNVVSKKNYATDYFISLFPKLRLTKFDIAEFGIGRGANLFHLSHFVHTVHGFDGSKLAVEHFLNAADLLLPKETYSAQTVNLCAPIETNLKFDVIIYGFFAYMVTDNELLATKKNTDKMLKDGGYIFVYDFLSQTNIEKIDTHNNALKVYKRNLQFWMNHFDDYVLIDFRLMDNEHFQSYILNDLPSHIDLECSMQETDWAFTALFKKRESL